MIRSLFYMALCFLAFISCRKHSLNIQVALNDLIETGPLLLTKDTSAINSSLNGMFVTLPGHYSQTSKNYPLLVFIHGSGQIGNSPKDLSLLLNDGVAQLIYIQKFPATFKVNGKNFSFIILNPQFNKFPSTQDVEDILVYARRTYRIDSSRVYLSGLSTGGMVATKMGADYPSQLAAIVPVSGVVNDSSICQRITAGHLPVWAFHNNKDPLIKVSTAESFISIINSFTPSIVPRLTVFKADNHDAWTAALNPHYKEDNLNIYERMLQYSR